MITCLHIQNIATIENLFIEFDQGLSVLTGETGAGKSLMIESISILLGQKVQSRIIREGAKSADIQGIFDLSGKSKAISWLEEEGLDCEDPTQIVMRRQISGSKRSRFWISGQIVPLAKVREFSQFLAQVNHQHEQVNLQKPQTQMKLYDAYCQTTSLVEKVAVCAKEISDFEKQIQEIMNSSREREQRLDYLNFQLKEFDSINLKDFSDSFLFDESQKLKNVQELQELGQEALECISSSEEMQSGLGDLAQVLTEKISSIASIDSSWNELEETTSILTETIADLERSIISRIQSLEEDPERLNELDDQIAQFRKLERKYGKGYKTLCEARTEIEEEKNSIETSSSSVEILKTELKAKQKDYTDLAEKLSKTRKKNLKAFSTKIIVVLKSLDMPKAKFQVSLPPSKNDFSKTGNENVEFQFSANGNKELSAIGDTASGGELSRLSLALALLDQRDEKPDLFIFDEIDSGISGETLLPFGKVLKKLAENAQIICISHNATIASYADHHLFMSKAAGKGSKLLQSKASKLDKKERREEIARLLDGRKTKQSLTLASSMLQSVGT